MRVQKGFSPSSPRGFVVIDGVNGAGKSTVLRRIEDWCTESGTPLVLTREPGGTRLGVKLREILLQDRESAVCSKAEAFLFAADRSQHIAEIISPRLNSGQLVVSDRYYYSTVAFQGYGREQDLKFITSVNSLAVGDCLPDLVILLDCDPSLGLSRKYADSTKHSQDDRFEEEQLSFHQRIREGFLLLAEKLPEPFAVVDASQDPETVWSEVFQFLNPLVKTLSSLPRGVRQ